MIKNIMQAFLATTLLVSCGETQQTVNSPAKETAPGVEDISSNPDYKKGLALVGQNDCLTCHGVNEKIVGPPYAEIAAKYAGAADTTITRLAHTVIKGGSGHWGTVPMTPHPGVSEEDAVQMVKYVLLLKK